MQLDLIDTDNSEVEGRIERIFYNQDGYVIAKIANPAFDNLVVAGNMLDPAVGQRFVFYGKLKPNDRYPGQKLELTGYRSILPSTSGAIYDYLINVAKWVQGPTASKIIEAYGKDALKIIKESPERVAADISGITLERAKEMQHSLLSNERNEAAIIEVNTVIGGILPPATARKAVARWGSKAAKLIQRNPFRLTRLRGVGFRSADAIWQKLGRPLDARRRHVAAVEHSLAEIAADGSTVAPRAEVLGRTAECLGGPLRDRSLEFAYRVGSVKHHEGMRESLADLSDAEDCIAGTLLKLLESVTPASAPKLFPPLDVGDASLAIDQRAALMVASSASVALLVGAPGTGKTFTLARIVGALRGANLCVRLCAPTGKAAKQMTRALADVGGGQAQTIHSLLAGAPDEDGEWAWGRSRSNPLELDVLVVDEMSIVDVRLMAALLDALPPTCRLILVGDHYQLPSVGPGAVLRDLLANFPAAELTSIKRNTGRIVQACHAIKDGEMMLPCLKLDEPAGQNWRELHAGTPGEIVAIIDDLLSTKLKRYDPALDLLWDVQIISPLNEKGPLSCKAINDVARLVLNPNGEPVGKSDIRVNDKIVRVKNGNAKVWNPKTQDVENDDVRVVNGDVGQCLGYDKRFVYCRFDYPERYVAISRGEPHLKPAYCLTCHKMQGSEAPIVILPLHPSFVKTPLWTREWVYTAFSRAKRALITIGQWEAIRPVLPRRAVESRRTRLAECVQERMCNAQSI